MILIYIYTQLLCVDGINLFFCVNSTAFVLVNLIYMYTKLLFVDEFNLCVHSTAFVLVNLTLYSILMPFDTFEILCVRKYYGKSSICSLEQMLHFP